MRLSGAGLVDRPLPASLVVAVGWAATYQIVIHRAKRPVLLGRLDPTTRSVFYGSLAGSAGALLGLTLATVAILLTLDNSRAIVEEMQSLRAWRTMIATLLVTIAALGVTLALSTLALAVDSAKTARQTLETAVTAIALSALVELTIGCIAFAVVVLNVTRR